jgi:hypothetical protein
MKFNIEIDCTPEEVRRLMGLPDLTPVHDAYLDKIKDSLTKGVTPDVVEQMVRTWVPGSATGIDMMRELIGGFAGGAKDKGKKGS